MGGVVKTIGSIFGGGDSAPQAQAAPIMTPVTTQQATDAYTQQQQLQQQQHNLAGQLGAQNGIQNQSNVYNALQNVATGQGYNPAQAMLNNATGANTANQAALMASGRGAGANPGQIARLAAQQGAANQQNAVGQGAALQAQQSLGALGQQGGLATQMVGQQMGQTNQNAATNLGEQQALLNSIAGVNTANVANTSQMNQNNTSRYNAAQDMSGNMIGGLMGGAASAIGGPVAKIFSNFAEGGPVDPIHNIYYAAQGGALNGEKHAKTMEPVPGKAKVKGDSIKNDTVPAKLSPGEIIIPKSVMESEDPMKEGTKFLADALRKNGKKGSEDSDFKSALKRAAGARK